MDAGTQEIVTGTFVMAQIIDLESFRRPRPTRETIPSGGAEILFFLGVRYERTDAPAEPPGPAGGMGRRRRKRA